MGKKSDQKKSKKDKDKKKLTAQTKKSAKESTAVNPQLRLDMIAEAAYFIAEKHGFDPQRVTQDWQQAEEQIDEMLKSKYDEATS
ncbi:MAG: DUF2934 domain-containing protein [Candidatus Thiodiazotropha sp. (ex Lucina pensylvanica)]|nr:DUF2934 domain-containing protein [Candidatus Thiodiazotropha sp. (ex Lucina pensylvanica)]